MHATNIGNTLWLSYLKTDTPTEVRFNQFQ